MEVIEEEKDLAEEIMKQPGGSKTTNSTTYKSGHFRAPSRTSRENISDMLSPERAIY